MKSNALAAPATITSAPLNLGDNSTATIALLTATSETAPKESPGFSPAWQEDDSSFFMPERCTPLDDF